MIDTMRENGSANGNRTRCEQHSINTDPAKSLNSINHRIGPQPEYRPSGNTGGNAVVTRPAEKALFIPLKTKWFEQFASGEKTSEIRKYGPRWNEHTCRVGRRVLLSKGYGKQARLSGVIWQFHKRRADTFGSTYQAAVLETFGTVDLEVAELRIVLDR